MYSSTECVIYFLWSTYSILCHLSNHIILLSIVSTRFYFYHNRYYFILDENVNIKIKCAFVHGKIKNNCSQRDSVGITFVKLYIYVVRDTQLFYSICRLKTRNSVWSYWIIYIDWFNERVSSKRLLQKISRNPHNQRTVCLSLHIFYSFWTFIWNTGNFFNRI